MASVRDLARDMIYAAEDGELEEVRHYLNKGVNVNSIEATSGRTALHYTSIGGYIDIAELLLDKGIDTNVGNKDGWTALHYACMTGCIDIVCLLINKGCNIEAANQAEQTALHIASCSNHADIVSLLLDKGVNIHVKGRNDTTALHQACTKGAAEVVLVLLDRGSDINAVAVGATPLMLSCHIQWPRINKILVDRGCDIHVKNRENLTALHWASFVGDLDTVKLLLEKGGDVKAVTDEGMDVLGYAKTGLSSQHESMTTRHNQLIEWLESYHGDTA